MHVNSTSCIHINKIILQMFCLSNLFVGVRLGNTSFIYFSLTNIPIFLPNVSTVNNCKIKFIMYPTYLRSYRYQVVSLKVLTFW